jgi:drug/metabolite transporter (DMT)-like permease
MICVGIFFYRFDNYNIIKVTNYIYIITLVAIISRSIILKESITTIILMGIVCILLGEYVSDNGVSIKRKQN